MLSRRAGLSATAGLSCPLSRDNELTGETNDDSNINHAGNEGKRHSEFGVRGTPIQITPPQNLHILNIFPDSYSSAVM